MAFRHEHVQTTGLDLFDEFEMGLAMPFPAVLQSFFLDQTQGFEQRVEHRGRGGVMVAVGHHQIVGDQADVEIPGAASLGALLQQLGRTWRHGDGRQARRTAQALLRAAVGHVDPGLVDLDRHGAQRRHAVGDHDRADFVSGLADGLAALEHAGRGLGRHVHHDLGLLPADELRSFLVTKILTPGLLEADDLSSLALGHFGHPITEVPAGEHHDLGVGIDEVGDGRLHAGAAGAGDDEREFVLSAEHLAEHLLDAGADLEEVGIEMPDYRLRQGLVDPGMHLTRAGAKQETLGWVNGHFFADGEDGFWANHESSWMQLDGQAYNQLSEHTGSN